MAMIKESSKEKTNLDYFLLPKNPRKNPPNPLISIVIPAFQEEKFLPRALQSILRQEYQNFELIVVDNNSSDKTSEIAKSYGAKVLFEPKQGVGFARQRGFLAAKGEVVATTDADTILPKDWLSRIAEEFKKNQNLVAFGGLYTLYSGPVTARLGISYFIYPVWLLDKFFSGGWSLPGANLAVRKDAFLKIGGFDTGLSLGEDADISQRLKNIGKVVLDPKFLVQTSGRRFRHGLLFGLLTYAPNGIFRMLFKKHKFVKLSVVREEHSLIGKFSFMPLVVLAIFLFCLFQFYNPSVSEAKEIKLIKEKIVLTEAKIKEKEHRLKEFLPYLRGSR